MDTIPDNETEVPAVDAASAIPLVNDDHFNDDHFQYVPNAYVLILFYEQHVIVTILFLNFLFFSVPHKPLKKMQMLMRKMIVYRKIVMNL